MTGIIFVWGWPDVRQEVGGGLQGPDRSIAQCTEAPKAATAATFSPGRGSEDWSPSWFPLEGAPCRPQLSAPDKCLVWTQELAQGYLNVDVCPGDHFEQLLLDHFFRPFVDAERESLPFQPDCTDGHHSHLGEVQRGEIPHVRPRCCRRHRS